MRRMLLLVSVAAFAIFSNPTRAQFCPGAAPWVFDDVPSTDLFCGYITWAAQNGITLGCAIIDANHRLYCPSDAVTRSQMAAFVNRLGNVRVEAVGTGPGLTGGPITSVGTINLATTQLLPTSACGNGQIARWNGSAWACSSDLNSGGTVTSVDSGTGLAGGPITASGSLSIATGYQLPQGCANGQVAKSNGSNVWTCASDSNSGGTVTSITAGNGLTGGVITTSGTIAVDPASSTLTGNFFKQNGNAFAGTAILGTTDNNALDIRVNGSRVMRYEPDAISPNVIGGHTANNVTAGVRGATIAGGGVAAGNTDPDFSGEAPNRVTDAYGTVGGGYGNRAGDSTGTTTDAAFATVGGGMSNTASGFSSTVSGGGGNSATGIGSTIAGGQGNIAGGHFSAVVGGFNNVASGQSSIAAGYDSQAGGYASFAGGYSARATHSNAFAWSSYDAIAGFPFFTVVDNEFAARAIGGVRFVTAVDGAGNPSRTVKINPNGELDFGSQARQMLNLWGPSTYGIGVQSATLYSRTSQFFAWFMSGVHSDSTYDPGLGGQVLATLQAGASATTVVGTFRAQAFTATSDRNAKTDFAPADGAEVLDKVVSLPIATWSYLNEHASGVRHIGPTAQDFKERFEVGYDDKTIATVDADGVALAANQGLNAKLEARLLQQAREMAELKAAYAADVAELRRAIEVLMAGASRDASIAAR